MQIIGFIGVGALADYTIKGVRRGGYEGTILLSPRNREKAEQLALHHNCNIEPDNQSVVSNSDYVVIATRPADCLEALAKLEFSRDQTLISVVAGIEIEQLRSALPAGLEIIRAMPVSSAEANASPTLIYPDNEFTRNFFDCCGTSIITDNESYFNQGSVLACVYCWFFSLYQALIEATEGPQLPQGLSTELVMGMAKGAAELALDRHDSTPGEIARSIATEGTFSKLGLDLLEEKSAFEPWREACKLLQKQLAAGD